MNIVRALLLWVGISGMIIASGGFPSAPAQEKKDKKDAKDAKAAKAGTIEIYKDRAGDFRFRVKDADGKVVAMPPSGYETKEECQKALDFIKTTLNTVKPTEVKDEKK